MRSLPFRKTILFVFLPRLRSTHQYHSHACSHSKHEASTSRRLDRNQGSRTRFHWLLPPKLSSLHLISHLINQHKNSTHKLEAVALRASLCWGYFSWDSVSPLSCLVFLCKIRDVKMEAKGAGRDIFKIENRWSQIRQVYFWSYANPRVSNLNLLGATVGIVSSQEGHYSLQVQQDNAVFLKTLLLFHLLMWWYKNVYTHIHFYIISFLRLVQSLFPHC